MNTQQNPSPAPASNMNIRRFVAENSRAALRQVRDTLGGDAIILANRTVEGGVEVLAAAPEAVDALTRRMTTIPASSLPVATPTELGLRRSHEAGSTSIEPVVASTPSVGRKRLASLFSRRTQAQAEVPGFAEQTTSTPKAAGSYARFADELAAVTDSDDDFVARLAPEAVTLSRPASSTDASSATSVASPVAAPIVAAEPVAAAAAASASDTPVVVDAGAPVVEAARPAASAPAIPAEHAVTVSELNEAVAREVSREIGRELGRDVFNDFTRDVSREVSQAVTGDVVRDVTRDMTRELRALQATISEQLSTLTWTDSMRRQPARTKLMQDLILAGFSPALSRHIQERLPDDYDSEEARSWAESILRRNLPVANDAEELINEGGVFALVGPTGVGKTTTVAKLAARFALKHGVDRLALITTDGFRIGAQDQLRIYGKILGVAVHSIHDQPSLTSAIEHLKDKKLVLIDTAGLGQRDERVAEQIAMLRGAKARRLVVLNATADAETLDHVVTTFADREFAGCVVTKTDEAARLGPVLDTVIRHRLRIHHVSTGQKVPEDLERPDGAALVHRALVRPAARGAFELKVEDEAVWMDAMAAQAQPVRAVATAASHGATRG